MRIYETGLVLAPNLSEEDTEKIILQMAGVISQKEGKLIKQERWGKRKLAYPVKKFNEGFYVFFHYEGKAEIPVELERRFKQTDAVLRYLTLKKEALEAARRKRKKEAGLEEKEVPASGQGTAVKEPSEGEIPSGEAEGEVK